MSDNNKKLYNKILNSINKSIDNIPEAGFALGYPYFGTNKTTLLKHGGNDVTRVKKCEDTIFAPGQGEFEATVLIIGGGAGGGTALGGGGGGAGGYREFTKTYYTGTSYTVTVGAGGSASSTGSDSSIERIGSGGGAGGVTTGGNGGSGGGGNGFFASSGGSSTSPRCNGSSQGNNGASGAGSFAQGGGGGGSAAAASGAGNGGNGTASTITGSSVTRAGGGGGGDTNGGFGITATPGSGGSGGGGNGGSGNQSNNSSQAAGANGTTNTGGGGGGGAYYKDSPAGSNLSGTGGNGGSGFVVIKFPDTHTITIGGGLTSSSSTSGGYTTVQFTAGTDTISFAAQASASASSIEIIDSGNYGWSGAGTAADPYVTTYFNTFYSDEAIRGGSPGNWTSSNRPVWEVSGSGTFNYTITGMGSGDDDADHALYKSTDGGSSWTLVHTFVFGSSASRSASFSVADGDMIEQRGDGAFYNSDTWVFNPTIWLS